MIDALYLEMMFNTHAHWREGAVVEALMKYAWQGGADTVLPMPNTTEGLLTIRSVKAYLADLRRYVISQSLRIIPCFMFTEHTTIEMIDECADEGVFDTKVYPLDRTTNSENGVYRYVTLIPKVRRCGERGIRVHLHPEYPWMKVIGRDAEYLFIPIAEMFLQETNAVIIWEHGTDARCIPLWKDLAKRFPGRFYITLTAHHLATNEDETFGDVRATCKPPLKTERDRLALIELVWMGYDWVLPGLDDAPHDMAKKHVHEGRCACGAFTSPFGMQLYLHAMDERIQWEAERGTDVGRMLNAFFSHYPREAYGLPKTSYKVGFVREPFLIPLSYPVGPWTVESFWANRKLLWSPKSF